MLQLLLIILAVACCLRIVAWKLIKRYFYPELRHFVQEAQIITKKYDLVDSWCEATQKVGHQSVDTANEQLQRLVVTHTTWCVCVCLACWPCCAGPIGSSPGRKATAATAAAQV